ncbi:MAG: Polysaccharide biosynthesis protein [candidate division BRC1 bacterium ADurb.BinA364]|nr:MAG: Polysaccharide biosynthesis protein [candidate division BRC1 bacterium ADurb.BinA364]
MSVFVRNIGASFGSKILVRALTFAVTICLANHLGQERYGVFFFITQLAMLLLAFIDLGWSMMVMRDAGRDPAGAGRALANFLGFQIASSLLFCLGFVAFFYIMDYPAEWRALAIAATLGLFAGGLNKAPYATLVGVHRADLASYTEVGASALSSMLYFLAIGFALPLWAFIAVFDIYFALVLILALAFSRRAIGPLRLSVDKALWARMARDGLPCSLIAASYVLLSSMDWLMLSRMTGANSRALGLYGAAFKLTAPFILIVEAAMLTVLPQLSSRYAAGPSGFRLLLDKSIKGLLAAGLPIAAGLALLAPEIIRTLLPEYGGAAGVLRLLAWRLPAIFGYAALNHALLAANRTYTLAAINVSGIALNFALNWFWIPRWGPEGAAAATSCSHGAILVFYFAARRWFFQFRVPAADAVRLAAALGAMAGALVAWQMAFGETRHIPGLLVRVGLGAAVYGAALAASGFIGPDERPYLQREWDRLVRRRL